MYSVCMPRLTESRRTARREQIAAAAMRCFASKGFTDTSMADIIREAGLSAGSIYSHFDSKADLTRFVAATLLESRTSALASDASPGEVVRTILRPLDRKHAILLLQVWAEALRNPELASLVRDQADTLRSAIEARLPATPGHASGTCAAVTTDAVLSAIQGYVVRVSLDAGIDAKELAASIAAMVDR